MYKMYIYKKKLILTWVLNKKKKKKKKLKKKIKN